MYHKVIPFIVKIKQKNIQINFNIRVYNSRYSIKLISENSSCKCYTDICLSVVVLVMLAFYMFSRVIRS